MFFIFLKFHLRPELGFHIIIYKTVTGCLIWYNNG